MDGFNRNEAADRDAYTQFLPEDLPNYWHWAERFVLLDNFFTSAHGPSFQNHLYAIAAQSGWARTRTRSRTASCSRSVIARRACSRRGDATRVDDAYVEVVREDGGIDHAFPCFDFETAGDLLDAKRIPWAYYSATPYQNGYLWSAYSAIRHYRNDPDRWAQHVFPVDDLVRDIQARTGFPR